MSYEDKPTLSREKLEKLSIEELQDLLGSFNGKDWWLIRKIITEKKLNIKLSDLK